eukprot:5097629-Amphidinium_carterae.1
MIATRNNVAAKLGQTLVTLRIGGADLLAEAGMELLKITLLGRWKKVVHDAGLAPIKNSGGDLDKTKQHSTLRQTIDEMATSLSKVGKKMAEQDANAKERLRQELDIRLNATKMHKD